MSERTQVRRDMPGSVRWHVHNVLAYALCVGGEHYLRHQTRKKDKKDR